MLGLHLVKSLAFAYVLYSLVEYTTHRYLMHRMRIARKVGIKFFSTLCINHMSKHHKRGYDHDTDEQDDHLSHILIAAACVGLPVAPFVYMVDPFTAYVCAGFGAVYSTGWWFLHLEMHRDKGWFFARNAVFRYLERQHQLHHHYPDSNFNIVLPLFDWVFGTYKHSDRRRRVRFARS